jgi:mono/diheme cytochrome c family protein
VDENIVRAKKGLGMKYTERVGTGRIGLLAAGMKRIGCLRQRLSCAVVAFALVVLAAGMGRTLYAGEATAAGQWNIMVVPARLTAYSGEARLRFEKNCASCHSKDGRAQTPVARQNGVRDLSESTLTDEQIIEQILQGTHGKVVDFKMPPFKEKLTRAEVDALVPVIKAFRPVTPNQSIAAVANPQLAGIIDFPGRKAAVLEKVAHSGRFFILNLNESHDGIQLRQLEPAKGAVRVSVAGASAPVTLKLDAQLVQAVRANTPGFLRRLFSSAAEQQHSLALDQANTELVLFLYAQCAGRTLLRSPHLPAATFTFFATGSTPGQIARRMESALAESGIQVIADGSKFAFVVPASEAAKVQPGSANIITAAGAPAWAAAFPGGAYINFPGIDAHQVAALYPLLTGRTVDEARWGSSTCNLSFTTQTPLNAAECSYALDTVFSLAGLEAPQLANDPFRSRSGK